MINQITINGRLCADCELRKTTSGMSVASFRIANDYDYRDKSGNKVSEPLFIDCSLFGNRAEALAKYTRKGSQIVLRGRLKKRSYTAKDGTNREVAEIVVEDFDFVGSEPKAQEAQAKPQGGHLDEIDIQDDDLPF